MPTDRRDRGYAPWTDGWMIRLSGLILASVLLTNCGRDEGSVEASTVVREIVGDTVVVWSQAAGAWGTDARLVEELRIGRLEGEEWEVFGDIEAIALALDGSILVVDRQVPALRRYGPTGDYLGTLGGDGEGPGEYRRPDGGLGVLSDGRIVLRDPGNGRFQLYEPTGEPSSSFRFPGNVVSSEQLTVGPGDRVYTPAWINPEADPSQEEMGLIGYDAGSGLPVDTLEAPVWDFDPPRLWAYNEAELPLTMAAVPFSPQPHWKLNALGHEVSAFSSEYRIDVTRGPNAILSIRRESAPVRIAAPEIENLTERLTKIMRRALPTWSWDGPPVPTSKPAFREIIPASEGRIWVRIHLESHPIPPSQLVEPDDPTAIPPVRWTEGVAFDVFEADGSLLGRVSAPDGLRTEPKPVFQDDVVWAVVRGEFGEDYVVRYRVVWG